MNREQHEQLIELDASLKRQAQRAMEFAMRTEDNEHRQQLLAICGNHIEQARGVRMAIDLLDGGKLVGDWIIPGKTRREIAEMLGRQA